MDRPVLCSVSKIQPVSFELIFSDELLYVVGRLIWLPGIVQVQMSEEDYPSRKACWDAINSAAWTMVDFAAHPDVYRPWVLKNACNPGPLDLPYEEVWRV